MRRGLTEIPVFRQGDNPAGPARYFVSPAEADMIVAAGLALSLKGRAIALNGKAIRGLDKRATVHQMRDVSARMNGHDMFDYILGKRKATEAIENWHRGTDSNTKGGPCCPFIALP